MMKYKENWEEAKVKWANYWKHQNTGRPLMCVVARKPEIEHLADGPADGGIADVICQGKYYNMPEELGWKDMEDKYQNPKRMVERYRQFCENHLFLAESFPNLTADFGPGSLASYLGSDIGFKEDTVWFTPCFEDAEDWEEIPELKFDPESKWFQKHLEVIKGCVAEAKGDFYVDIPDMMENIDVLASLRGTEDLLCDMMDDPDAVKERVKQVTKAYYQCLDAFYDAVKDEEGASAYTVFQVWGPGRTVKLQCDTGAMLSPDMFHDMILDSLKEQAAYADSVLYHLDGPDNIRHLDTILQVEGIDALQWTSGDAGPDGTLEEWDQIYDKARAAGKSLWIKVYSGGFEDWIRNVDRVVQKYGSHSLFLFFPEMSLEQANKLIAYANEHWSDVKGTFNA
ncbi:MAG: uroporphyrinogen decarboxylase family protein [Lachnospiraceae bacterium]|nr:uroporphyrinogen decarboxylase family protein [Lachnospiraceae bacterium]